LRAANAPRGSPRGPKSPDRAAFSAPAGRKAAKWTKACFAGCEWLMKNRGGQSCSGKVYCRFSGPICRRQIASRRLRHPIFRARDVPEIFRSRFAGGKSPSRKILRPFLLRTSLPNFFMDDFPWEIGLEISASRFFPGNRLPKSGEGDWQAANRA
jgi:hypothetical protein